MAWAEKVLDECVKTPGFQCGSVNWHDDTKESFEYSNVTPEGAINSNAALAFKEDGTVEFFDTTVGVTHDWKAYEWIGPGTYEESIIGMEREGTYMLFFAVEDADVTQEPAYEQVPDSPDNEQPHRKKRLPMFVIRIATLTGSVYELVRHEPPTSRTSKTATSRSVSGRTGRAILSLRTTLI